MKRDPAIVSKTMSAIRGKNTGIERKLRKALTDKGIRYRLYSSRVEGHPDILLPSLKIAVFCDSEFWHGYHFEENVAQLERLSAYWLAKIRRNIARDEYVNEQLKKQGYTVLRFWGSQIEKDLESVVATIEQAIEERKRIEAWRAAIKERTTLVYIEQDDKYLLLHRVKEEGDMNEGKWLGVGGHLEGEESPVAAMKREVFEETGLTVTAYKYYGALDFLNDEYPPERMYLYKVTGFQGEIKECDEGVLAWVKKDEMMDLPMWEGDKAFLPLLDLPLEHPIRMNLIYRGGALDRVEGPFYPEPKKQPKKKRKK